MTSAGELILLQAVKATRASQGPFVLTQKYLEGVEALARHWPGKVTSLVELADEKSTDFDHVPADPEQFNIEVRPSDRRALMKRLSGASAVLAFLSRRDAPLAPLCRAAGIPLLYVTEYTPETEQQIMRESTPGVFLRLRRSLYLKITDRQRRRAAELSAGLQCSGRPTYDYYRDIQQNCLLFFDNRLLAADIMTQEACQAKCAGLTSDRPLHLVYGGRFVPMKGVMHLPDVARALKERAVPFRFDVYGDGPQKAALAARISEYGLDDVMRICAPVDFRTGWVKMLKEQADLFVCCHPQGDPSSTFPEVMSCGVPIVGYDNEAFRGVVDRSGVGWMTPVGDPLAVAQQITALNADRSAIQEAALKGLQFGHDTAFETTFGARAQQLLDARRV